jgi:beta-galactosidase
MATEGGVVRSRRLQPHAALVLVASLALAAAGVVAGFVVVLPSAATTTYTPAPLRQRMELAAGWRFHRADVPGAQNPRFNDSGWATVSVPHTWNAQDGQDGGGDYHRGVGWYRRHLMPGANFAGKRLWLQFAGVDSVADVWVNGKYLGQHRGGYSRFRFDATAALQVGQDNVVAVKVSNAPVADVAPLSADYTFFGGIYRGVTLWGTDQLSVSMLDLGGPGIYVRQRALDARSATVDVIAYIANNTPYARPIVAHVVVTDAHAGVVVQASAPRIVEAGATSTVVQTVKINKPRVWQGRADPYLYRANVEVRDPATGQVTDEVTERFGLRTVSVDPGRGLFLNGSHLAVHGVSRHQDRPGKGWAISDGDQMADFDIMDEMGVNALRTAHYQQDQRVYNLADERGYLVWTEIPLVNSITDSAAFRSNAEQQLRELIRQNYNHPSIVFWGIGNEQGADDPATNALLDGLARVVAEEDPDRLSAYAHNGPVGSGLTGHAEVTGVNRYGGWYYGSCTDLGGYLDQAHATTPTRPLAISEYGAGGSIAQHEANPARPVPGSDWHPEEYQALFHEEYWTQIQARPYLWGAFVWNMFDFAADQRGEGDAHGRNDKGLVTYDRATRKDAFYWYKANWTSTPFVYLTSRRWTDRVDPTTTVKVYGTADTVLLRINGVTVGKPQTSSNHIYTWSGVSLMPGANTIDVVGVKGDTTFTDTVVWDLRLVPGSAGRLGH